jgi:hypothetical protein
MSQLFYENVQMHLYFKEYTIEIMECMRQENTNRCCRFQGYTFFQTMTKFLNMKEEDHLFNCLILRRLIVCVKH